MRNNKGFTLMEVMIATALLIILLATLRLMQTQMQSASIAKIRTTAMSLANRLMVERENNPAIIVIGTQQVEIRVDEENRTYKFRIDSNFTTPQGNPVGNSNLIKVRIRLINPNFGPPGSDPKVNPTLVENIIAR